MCPVTGRVPSVCFASALGPASIHNCVARPLPHSLSPAGQSCLLSYRSPQFPPRAAASVLICDVGEALPSYPPLPDPATLKIDPGPLEAVSPTSASMPRVGTAFLTPSSSEPLEQNTTDWVTQVQQKLISYGSRGWKSKLGVPAPMGEVLFRHADFL